MARQRSRRKPTDLRQSLDAWEPGAHLYAEFGNHVRAGILTLLPAVVLYLATQGTYAVSTIVFGGFTVVPAVLVVVGGGWAFLSTKLLHRLRFNRNVWVHYAAYAAMGAIALWLASFPFMALVGALFLSDPNPFAFPTFNEYMWAAPAFGALGSLIGRFALSRWTHWHVLIERPPLPDVFGFVEGKRDRDEFERM